MSKASELIVRVLEEAGVTHVFGVPGGGAMQLYEALYARRDRFKVVLVRHEQAAAIMADAYGRATGKPALITGQGVFMGSNASFGIMEAFLSSSPMLVITDTSDGAMPQHPVNQSGVGEYGSIDLPAIFRAMTKYTTVAAYPKESVIGTQLAIKHATTGRPGPACVVMRSAAIAGEVDVESPPFIHPTQGYLNVAKAQAAPGDIERAAALLAQAKCPAMVAGNGVHISQAHGALKALAELWGMPVATSYKGKSAIEETHPLAVGMMGIYGQAAANAAIGEADVVLVVGAKLTPQDTVRERPHVFDPRRQKIIQMDIEPRNAGWTFPVELGLVGDAKTNLELLLEASRPLAAKGKKARAGRTAALRELQEKHGLFETAEGAKDSAPVLPQRLVRVLQETLDPSTLVALDAGNNRVWMAHLYRTQQSNTVFAPGGMAGMGWALPAALGLQLARPDRRVVAVAGDGGFMMSISALSTAVQERLPVVSVVFNDSALGMVRHHQPVKRISSEFVDTDYAAIARSMGAFGVRVRDSRKVASAIKQALVCGGPAVVDVAIDRGPNPDDIRAVERGATET
ncbi:MAG: thiamine pyrophosphate-binding protein [Dehalococcoidia bacterium]|nr:thiamine pyrophosphate-binding protein [Dehalococcoidia bacterium]